MRLEKLEITTSFTAVTFCYSKPSASDWGVSRATLKVGSQETLNNSYSLIFDSDYGGYQGVQPPPTDYPQIQMAVVFNWNSYLDMEINLDLSPCLSQV